MRLLPEQSGDDEKTGGHGVVRLVPSTTFDNTHTKKKPVLSCNKLNITGLFGGIE